MTRLSLTLFFINPTHQRVHNMLVGLGFAFEIEPAGVLGRRYHHRGRSLQIELFMEDDDFWVVLRDLNRLVTDDDYSDKEWAWLDAADDEVEYLRRELHILFEVRPNFMIRPPTGD